MTVAGFTMSMMTRALVPPAAMLYAHYHGTLILKDVWAGAREATRKIMARVGLSLDKMATDIEWVVDTASYATFGLVVGVALSVGAGIVFVIQKGTLCILKIVDERSRSCCGQRRLSSKVRSMSLCGHGIFER